MYQGIFLFKLSLSLSVSVSVSLSLSLLSAYPKAPKSHITLISARSLSGPVLCGFPASHVKLSTTQTTHRHWILYIAFFYSASKGRCFGLHVAQEQYSHSRLFYEAILPKGIAVCRYSPSACVPAILALALNRKSLGLSAMRLTPTMRVKSFVFRR